MTVCNQEMVGVALVFDKQIAESANAGAGVDNENIIAFGSDFEACGIATIAEVLPAGNRNGSPGPPHPDSHHKPFFKGRCMLAQNNDTGTESNPSLTGQFPALIHLS